MGKFGPHIRMFLCIGRHPRGLNGLPKGFAGILQCRNTTKIFSKWLKYIFQNAITMLIYKRFCMFIWTCVKMGLLFYNKEYSCSRIAYRGVNLWDCFQKSCFSHGLLWFCGEEKYLWNLYKQTTLSLSRLIHVVDFGRLEVIYLFTFTNKQNAYWFLYLLCL